MSNALAAMDDDALEAYLAFVLDLYDRFEREGAKVMELFAPRERKPMRPVLYSAAAKAPARGGFVAEFGVHKGHSIRELTVAFPGRIIHGFDSFEGFPDDDREDWQQDFSVEELPQVPEVVKLHKGYFAETLPAFAADLPDGQTADFLHFDCDIYSSAKEVFTHLGDRIVPGTVCLFDELVNYDEFLGNEMLALYEWTRASGLGAEWAAAKGRLRPLEEFSTRIEGGFAGYRKRRFYQNAGLMISEDPGRAEREAAYLNEARALLETFKQGPSPLVW